MNAGDVVTGFLLLFGTLFLAVGGPVVIGGVMVGLGGLLLLISPGLIDSSDPLITVVQADLREALSITINDVPSLILLGVGIAIILGAVVAIPHPFDVPSQYEVSEGEPANYNTIRGSYNYSELSPVAKHAFHAALRSPDNEVILYGTRAPEFGYSWEFPTPYLIRYNGTTYRLETFNRGGMLPRWPGFLVLAVIGSVATVVGYLGIRAE